MREPGFWYGPPSAWSVLLAPVAAIYGWFSARRMQRPGVRIGIPVFCVGNYHLGGAGKTPTTLAIAHLLREEGETPFVVSRGYGGEMPGPLRVEPHHRASAIGDEPLMMSAHVPVVVSRDRVAGAQLAKAQGASVILLDDGFQNPSLIKDASLIVIDGGRALGNGQVFPAGPLRAPLEPQLARTDAIVVIGGGVAADGIVRSVVGLGGVTFRAAFDPAAEALTELQGKRLLAFAGIGDPARFFASLRSHELDVVKEKTFADHHRFTGEDILQLTAEAEAGALVLVTTEKDLARIISEPALSSLAKTIIAFPVTLRIDNLETLRALLRERLAKARNQS